MRRCSGSPGGSPDPGFLHRNVADIAQQAQAGGSGTLPGMVDLLCARGRPDAAIQLETMWNALMRVQRVSLLCTYALHHFRDVHWTPGLEDVCGCHTHVRLPFTS
jgi:hypothetical protein